MQPATFKQGLHHQDWQMSGDERPRAERQNTHPALSDAMFGVPVTPSISNEDKFPSFHHIHLPQEQPQHVLESIGAQGAPEYGNGNGNDSDWTPYGESLLRRLSLAAAGQKSEAQNFDPRASHPDLELSGNIISAAFCLPYIIGYTSTGEWVGSTSSSNQSNFADTTSGAYLSSRNVGPLRFFSISFQRKDTVEAYLGRLDWRNSTHFASN